MQIRKQKYYEARFIPDLTIDTTTDTIFIEVDTGKQPVKTLESKIRGLQRANSQATLIYFTNSDKNYSHFCQNCDVQFIYFDSPTLAQDILQLFSTNQASTSLSAVQNQNPTSSPSLEPSFNTLESTTSSPFFHPTSKASIKLAPNVFVHDPTLLYDQTVVSCSEIPKYKSIQWQESELDLEMTQAEVIKLLSEND